MRSMLQRARCNELQNQSQNLCRILVKEIQLSKASLNIIQDFKKKERILLKKHSWANLIMMMDAMVEYHVGSNLYGRGLCCKRSDSDWGVICIILSVFIYFLYCMVEQSFIVCLVTMVKERFSFMHKLHWVDFREKMFGIL